MDTYFIPAGVIPFRNDNSKLTTLFRDSAFNGNTLIHLPGIVNSITKKPRSALSSFCGSWAGYVISDKEHTQASDTFFDEMP
jgi:hypothetical protein